MITVKQLQKVLCTDVKIVNNEHKVLFEGDVSEIINEQQRTEIFDLKVDSIHMDDSKPLLVVSKIEMTVSHKVLNVMEELIDSKDPNKIDDLVYSEIVDDVEPGCTAEDISEAAANLMALMVD